MCQKVSFKESVTVRTISNRHDITHQEKCNTWYSWDELKYFKSSFKDERSKHGLDVTQKLRGSTRGMVVKGGMDQHRRNQSGCIDDDLHATSCIRKARGMIVRADHEAVRTKIASQRKNRIIPSGFRRNKGKRFTAIQAR